MNLHTECPLTFFFLELQFMMLSSCGHRLRYDPPRMLVFASHGTPFLLLLSCPVSSKITPKRKRKWPCGWQKGKERSRLWLSYVSVPWTVEGLGGNIQSLLPSDAWYGPMSTQGMMLGAPTNWYCARYAWLLFTSYVDNLAVPSRIKYKHDIVHWKLAIPLSYGFCYQHSWTNSTKFEIEYIWVANHEIFTACI